MKAEYIGFLTGMVVSALSSYFLLSSRAKKSLGNEGEAAVSDDSLAAHAGPPAVAVSNVAPPPMMHRRPAKAEPSVLSTLIPKLIRLVVIAVLAAGGYYGYVTFAPKSASGASKVYQEFSEDLVKRRYDEAKQKSKGAALKQVDAVDKQRYAKEKMAYSDSSPPIVVGMGFKVLSETKQDADTVNLKGHQMIRYDPISGAFGVGMVGAISKPGGATGGSVEDLIHEATLVRDGATWKITTFTIKQMEIPGDPAKK